MLKKYLKYFPLASMHSSLAWLEIYTYNIYIGNIRAVSTLNKH